MIDLHRVSELWQLLGVTPRGSSDLAASLDQLTAPQPRQRAEAVAGLLAQPDRVPLEPLLQALLAEPTPSLDADIGSVLHNPVDVGTLRAHVAVVAGLALLLARREQAARHALGLLLDGPPRGLGLWWRMSEDEPVVYGAKPAALAVYGATSGRDSDTRLRRLLLAPDEDAWLRVQAALTMARSPREGALAEVVAAVLDPSFGWPRNFRPLAVRLARLGPAAAAPTLPYRHHPDPLVRRRARQLLEALGVQVMGYG